MWTQNGKSIRESKSSHFMPDTSIHYTSTVCLYYILIFNVMSKICMICPSMPTASNYIYLPPIWSLGCFWGAKFGTENAASPTIHNGFRSPVEIPGNFFGGYAKWSHDWTKKKKTSFPLRMVPMGKPMETHGKFQPTDRGVKKEVRTFTNLVQNLGFPPCDAVRKVETFPPEFYWVEYVSSMNLCFFEWDVSSARCAELKITSLLIFPTQLIEICCSTLPVNLCVGMIAVTDPIAWRYRPCKFWIETMLGVHVRFKDSKGWQLQATLSIHFPKASGPATKTHEGLRSHAGCTYGGAPRCGWSIEQSKAPGKMQRKQQKDQGPRWWTGGKGCKED